MFVRPRDWESVVDVVVIGFGMAGAVSAITAADTGAQVLIVEKQPEDNFYNTSSLSGGAFIVSNNAARSRQYLEFLSSIGTDIPWTDRATIATWAEYATQNKTWMEGMGANVQLLATGGEHPHIEGSESIELWRQAGSGPRMMGLMREQVSRRGVAVSYGTPARKLLTDDNGHVVGVQVEMAGRVVKFGARGGVILCAGGFEFNDRMKLDYLRAYPAYFLGSPANTGDGIRMAAAIGADLWHMNCCSARWVAKFPEYPWAFTLDLGGKQWTRRVLASQHERQDEVSAEPAGYVVVDKRGQRFTNENHKLHCLIYELGVFDSQQLDFPRIPSYWIFDHNRLDEGPLCTTTSGPAGPVQLYHWTQDNRQELARGWIIGPDSIQGLAAKLDLPPGALERTVEEYNGACAQKRDEAFSRHAASLTPLNKPPFYAVRLWPGGQNTQGGPRRNAASQILNMDSEPIPGLYGAGEMGSVFGMLYPGAGGNLSECIVFGRIAGENAARERVRL